MLYLPMSNMVQRILAHASKRLIQQKKPFVIAITGSVGKTTTRQCVAAIMHDAKSHENVLTSKKNFNNELGLPLTLFNEIEYPSAHITNALRLAFKVVGSYVGLYRLKAETVILEMGADKPGDLALLTEIAPPDISIVTGVSPIDSSLAAVHQQFYKDADAVADEKATLVKVLKSDGTAILNADDTRVYAMRHKTSAHILGYGEQDGADIRLIQKTIMGELGEFGFVPTGIKVIFECYQKPFTIELPGVYGTSIAYAVCAAVSVAVALDLPEEKITQLPQHFTPMAGRVRIIPGIKQTTLFDDSYNASPSATLSSLQDLAQLPLESHQRRIACLGEHRELGDASEAMHYRLGVEAAKANVDVFVACGIFAIAMKEGALAAGIPAERITCFEDTPEAGLFIQSILQPGDIILAKASQGSSDLSTKGVRMERVIKELMAEPQHAKDLLVRQEKKWLQ